jgi:hypothetical protein
MIEFFIDEEERSFEDDLQDQLDNDEIHVHEAGFMLGYENL